MPTVDPRVEAHLRALESPYTVHAHRDFAVEIRRPADFAQALGYPLGRITKSIFCREHSTTSFAVLVAASAARVDFKLAADALGLRRMELANADELQRLTGYPRHGVSPFGLDTAIPVLVSKDLLGHPTVLVGAGVVGVEIEIKPADLVDATHALVGDFAKDV